MQTEEMPSEESAWLTASELRNAADIVLESSINNITRTNLQRESVGQTVLLDLAVTCRCSMNHQAVQQQLGLRRLQQALRMLILPNTSNIKIFCGVS